MSEQRKITDRLSVTGPDRDGDYELYLEDCDCDSERHSFYVNRVEADALIRALSALPGGEAAAPTVNTRVLQSMVERLCRFNCDVESSCACDAHLMYRAAMTALATSAPSAPTPAQEHRPETFEALYLCGCRSVGPSPRPAQCPEHSHAPIQFAAPTPEAGEE